MLTLLDIKRGLDPLDLAERQTSFLQEMLEPEALPRLKRNAQFTEYIEGLREKAETGPESAFKPLKFSIYEKTRQVGDRDGSLAEVYFGRHYTLTAQVLITLVDETDRYLPVIEDLIWLICNEYSWATPNHLRDDREPERMVDLFAAETAQMLAETITLLEGRLHPSVAKLARQRVEEKVFSSMFNEARTFAWEAAPNNWAAVCSGSVGMAALLLEQDRNRLIGMLRRILDTMACFLQGFKEDGGCAEGIAYWNYGFGFYVYFAESLRVFTNDQIDLLTDEGIAARKIRRIAAFPAGIALSNQTFLNYSDALVDMPLAPGLLSRVSQRIGAEVPRPPKLPDYPGRTSTSTKWAHASRTLCWTDDRLFGERKIAAGTVYFPDMAWLLDRRYASADCEQMIAFSAKGGHNREPHNHNDLGHFIIHSGGENILIDLGQGKYGKGYAESLNKISEGHSVPRINGQGQGQGRDYRAEVVRFREPVPAEGDAARGGSRTLRFELDLTKAYPVEALNGFVRHFEWQPPGADGSPAVLSLNDSFRFAPVNDRAPAGRNTVEELFISFFEPLVEDGAVVWKGTNGSVRLEFDRMRLTPAVEQFKVRSGNDGQTRTCYRLQLAITDLQMEDEVKLQFLVSAGSG